MTTKCEHIHNNTFDISIINQINDNYDELAQLFIDDVLPNANIKYYKKNIDEDPIIFEIDNFSIKKTLNREKISPISLSDTSSEDEKNKLLNDSQGQVLLMETQLFNIEVDKYLEGSFITRDLYRKKELDIKREKIKIILNKRYPDINIDKILMTTDANIGSIKFKKQDNINIKEKRNDTKIIKKFKEEKIEFYREDKNEYLTKLLNNKKFIIEKLSELTNNNIDEFIRLTNILYREIIKINTKIKIFNTNIIEIKNSKKYNSLIKY